ncbi:YcxB family protein [Kitasatospora sp. NPDC059648]|uniref:YcxB family protein n=1 Tax=Kitasatospora sp. NPDC059648 TaxID=3346894 RepID=UPI0036B9A7A8
MDIQVTYEATTEDIVASVTANASARPWLRWAIVGLWLLVAVACAAVGSTWFAIAAFFFGFVQVVNITAGGRRMGLKVAPRYVGPTTVRLTDDGLRLTTPATDRRIPWSAVNKVAHNPVAWTVLSQKVGTPPQSATVLKAPFTEAERAEFDAFLARLPKVSHKGRSASEQLVRPAAG